LKKVSGFLKPKLFNVCILSQTTWAHRSSAHGNDDLLNGVCGIRVPDPWAIKSAGLILPWYEKEANANPNGSLVFQCFAGIDLLTINEQRTLLLNIKDRQSIIVKVPPAEPGAY
jgi:hypothetical protein